MFVSSNISQQLLSSLLSDQTTEWQSWVLLFGQISVFYSRIWIFVDVISIIIYFRIMLFISHRYPHSPFPIVLFHAMECSTFFGHFCEPYRFKWIYPINLTSFENPTVPKDSLNEFSGGPTMRQYKHSLFNSNFMMSFDSKKLTALLRGSTFWISNLSTAA